MRGQLIVLILTFFSYASFHITRKSFSFAKVNMAYPRCHHDDEMIITNGTTVCSTNFTSLCTLNTSHPDGSNLPLCDSFFGPFSTTTNRLATLDTLFLFFYACGLFVAGHVEDRVDIRKTLVVGMILSSMAVLGFSLLAYGNVTTFWPYALLWSLNGLLQASGWPACVAIMALWFGSLPCSCFGKGKKCGRGAILGAWSGNASAGNVFSSYVFFVVLSYSSKLPGYASKKNGNWILAIAVSAGILFVVACFVYVAVRLPSETGWLDSAEDMDNDSGSDTEQEDSLLEEPEPLALDWMDGDEDGVHAPDDDQAISFCSACCIPGVIPYSLSYMCLKLANYAMFFWLPFYLSHQKSSSSSSATNVDAISSTFDYGQILGGFFAGWISDRLKSRSPVIVVMLLMSSCALFTFVNSPSLNLLVVMIPVTGFLLGGPANMISSAVAADLGGSVKGSGKALATVTGIIDGTGSLGASSGQYLVYLLSNCGKDGKEASSCTWTPVFVMLISCTVLAALFIGKLCLKDCRKCGKIRLVQ